MRRPKLIVHGPPARRPGAPRSEGGVAAAAKPRHARGLAGFAILALVVVSAGLPGSDIAYSWALPLNCPLHKGLTSVPPVFVPLNGEGSRRG